MKKNFISKITNLIKKYFKKSNNQEREFIIYKREYLRVRVVLKPNTFYWRLRYWINQYLAMILALIIKPVVKLNYEFWRINEGEEYISMCQINRIGMQIKEPDGFTIRIKFPFWIIRSKKLLKDAFNYFTNIKYEYKK
jgi:hypothetical protein